jgi:hypothetical protein
MADPKEFRDDRRYKWLKENLAHATSDLLQLHRAGTNINELVGEKQYGAKAIEKLSAGLEKSAQQLSDFRKYARQWTTREIERMVEKADRWGAGLSWHHFRPLLLITPRHYDSATEAKAKRRELIDACLKEGWSTRQMKEAVREELGRTKTKRALMKPDDFEQGLEEFLQHSEAYLRRFDEAWFGSGGVITTGACPKKLSPRVTRLRRDGNEVAQRLRSIVTNATEIRDELPTPKRTRN